jgi:putative membrane protein
MANRQRVLLEPKISGAAVRYHVLSTTLACVFTIVGILVLPLVIPLAWMYYQRYFDRLKVVLTVRDLQIDRGVLVREEKRIPLEKITDLATFQGPVMRFMGLRGLRVETAGQSGGAGGALVRIIGLENTEDFRERVLNQRDRVADRDNEPSARPTSESTDTMTDKHLTDIRDCLLRIEKRLAEDRQSDS